MYHAVEEHPQQHISEQAVRYTMIEDRPTVDEIGRYFAAHFSVPANMKKFYKKISQ